MLGFQDFIQEGVIVARCVFFHPDCNRRRRNFTGLCTQTGLGACRIGMDEVRQIPCAGISCSRAIPPVGNWVYSLRP